MKKQQLILIAIAAVYALLLLLTLGHNQISIKTGYVPQNIGHTLDSLTHKK